MDSTTAIAQQIAKWPEQHQRIAAVDRFVDALVSALHRRLHRSELSITDQVEILHHLAVEAEAESTMTKLGGKCE